MRLDPPPALTSLPRGGVVVEGMGVVDHENGTGANSVGYPTSHIGAPKLAHYLRLVAGGEGYLPRFLGVHIYPDGLQVGESSPLPPVPLPENKF